jgi:hypothetical protein
MRARRAACLGLALDLHGGGGAAGLHDRNRHIAYCQQTQAGGGGAGGMGEGRLVAWKGRKGEERRGEERRGEEGLVARGHTGVEGGGVGVQLREARVERGRELLGPGVQGHAGAPKHVLASGEGLHVTARGAGNLAEGLQGGGEVVQVLLEVVGGLGSEGERKASEQRCKGER